MWVDGVSALYLQKEENVTPNTVGTNPSKQGEKGEREIFFVGGKELSGAVNTANSRLECYNRRVEFSIHQKTGDVIIKIYDTDTGDVIREIPPEKIKDMIANLLEQVGLLVDERA